MKIKCQIKNNKVTGFDSYRDDYGFFIVEENEIEIKDETLISPFEPKYLKVVDGAVVRMTKAEKQAVDAAEAATVIDIEKVKKELFHAFKADIDLYLSIYSPISDFLAARNFADLKEYANILIKKGKVNADVFVAFDTILKQNNINLDNY